MTVRWLLLSSLYRHLRSQLLLNAQLGSVPLGASALLMREVLNDGVKLLCRWQPGCWASCFISSRHKFGCVPEAARQTHFLFFPSSSTDFIPYVFDLFPVSISCAPHTSTFTYTCTPLTFGLCLCEERPFCLIAVPTAPPELRLLHSFARLPCRGSESSLQERYVCHRSGLRCPLPHHRGHGCRPLRPCIFTLRLLLQQERGGEAGCGCRPSRRL